MELKDQLTAYRARHDHEWTLLNGRLATLMTSQSFLVIACGSLYGSNLPLVAVKQAVLLPLCSVALALCLMSAIVIAINCRVIRDWHLFRKVLIKADTKNELGEIDILRDTPDWKHMITADVFSTAIPLLFAALWIRAILHFLCPPKTFEIAPDLGPWICASLVELPAVVVVVLILCFGSAYDKDLKYRAAK